MRVPKGQDGRNPEDRWTCVIQVAMERVDLEPGQVDGCWELEMRRTRERWKREVV